MRVILIVKKASEVTGIAEEWAEMFRRRTGREVERMDPETREGDNFAKALDIVDYPAIVVIKDEDGKVSQMWQGRELPRIDDVMAYVV